MGYLCLLQNQSSRRQSRASRVSITDSAFTTEAAMAAAAAAGTASPSQLNVAKAAADSHQAMQLASGQAQAAALSAAPTRSNRTSMQAAASGSAAPVENHGKAMASLPSATESKRAIRLPTPPEEREASATASSKSARGPAPASGGAYVPFPGNASPPSVQPTVQTTVTSPTHAPIPHGPSPKALHPPPAAATAPESAGPARVAARKGRTKIVPPKAAFAAEDEEADAGIDGMGFRRRQPIKTLRGEEQSNVFVFSGHNE